MNTKGPDVKHIGDDQYGLKIVNTLIELRRLIDMASIAYEQNGEAIEELHLLRTDMEHMMADTFDDDPVKDALMQQETARRYREVQRRRRELITEDAALEHIIFDEEFAEKVNDMLEAMTGQMQFIDHAHYKPKSRLSHLAGGVTKNVYHGRGRRPFDRGRRRAGR